MPLDLRMLTAFDGVDGVAAVVPLGSLEQHCRLPVGLDCMVAERLAWLASGRAEEILASRGREASIAVAPPLCYGFSPEWRGLPGTVSLPLTLYTGLLTSIAEGLASWGFRVVVFFNGHGGNSHAARAAAAEAAYRLGVRVGVIDYWRPPRLRLGHACEVEEALARELGIAKASPGREGGGGCVEAHIHSGDASLYQGPPPDRPAWAPGGSPRPVSEIVEANARALADLIAADAGHAI